MFLLISLSPESPEACKSTFITKQDILNVLKVSLRSGVQLFFLFVFPFLDCIFKVYILLKGSVVDCDCDVVGVSTGGEKGHNC